MAPLRVTDPRVAQRKRQLRGDIARSRVRTTVALYALRDQRRRLTSWRTYVARFPQAALAASFGIGLWLAALRPARRIPRIMGASLIQWGLAAAKTRLWSEVQDIWTGSALRNRGPGPSGD